MALVVALVLAIGTPVAAAPPTPEATAAARAKLSQGAQSLRQGEYADALRAFQEAYQLVPSPKIHFNFGLAYQGLARYAEALESFQRFLDEARPASTDENAANARQQLEELERKVARVEIQCECPGADVLIDGRSFGKVPLTKPLLINPGSHQMALRRGREAEVQTFEAPAGGAVYLNPVLREEAARAPRLSTSPAPAPPAALVSVPSGPEAERRPLYKRGWFWGAVAGAVVAAAAVGVLVAKRGNDRYPTPTLGQRPVDF